MKLTGKFALFTLASLIMAVVAAVSWAGVGGTKHNLGVLSPATVKTTGTSEICVFCHAPHTSNPSSSIWNRADTGTTYEPYVSQTLAATIAPKPLLGQPTGASKLCLSCHDGTVALGTMLNLPGIAAPVGGTLDVTGPGVTAGKLTSASVSYIGSNLKDDHPISFSYSDAYPSNLELKSSPFTPAEVKLDGAGRLECTACHDPHGTAYPKFMLATLNNSDLCVACHDKLYWTGSTHATSGATWNGVGANPWYEDLGAAGFANDTPAVQGCLSCHRSHGGALAKTLLKGNGEEDVCLSCHNGNVAAKDIDASFNYTYLHDVKSGAWAGRHTPERSAAGDPAREAAASLDNANRHVECSDCHNGHGVLSGGHVYGTANSNTIGSTLVGGWGVQPVWSAAGNPSTVYTVADFTSTTPSGTNLEGYVCVKCHSYYAYGSLPPAVPSGNADGSVVRESDVTADFNANNPTYHPVFTQGLNMPGASANPNWPANGLGLTNTFNYGYYVQYGQQWETGALLTSAPVGLWSVRHDSTITCSDCHGSDTPTDPRGVHGSNEKWILRAEESGRALSPPVTQKNFCYNCHRRDVYGDEDYTPPLANYSRVSHPIDGLAANVSQFYKSGLNTGNNGNNFGILCLACHGGAYMNTDNLGVPLTNDVMQGIHGTNADVCGCQNNNQCATTRCTVPGPPAGAVPLANRAMNGACVEFHVPATTGTGIALYFRAINLGTDKVCNANFTDVVGGNVANYNY
ncbi:MAG: hypothetical protein HZB85_10290 [Deltaproteobacteria bacterium]|nr:hypothetical protein [Deltaproteobacteria bacterium]